MAGLRRIGPNVMWADRRSGTIGAVKPLLLTLTSLAAIVGMAGPARADSTDDAFLAWLRSAGITYQVPAQVIGAGKWVCQTVGKGMQMTDVVNTIQAQNPGLKGDDAARFTAIAANVYCPQTINGGRAPGPRP